MKKFNINDYIYIQITEKGWTHLRNTVGDDYITHYIKALGYQKYINGESWYRLQCHQVFGIFPIQFGNHIFFNSNIMIDDLSLTSLYIE